MKSIKLRVNGEEKTFTIPYVSGYAYRKYVELLTKVKDPSLLTHEEMDWFVELIVEEFNNQFTVEEYYKGIPFHKMMPTIEGLFAPEDGDEEENKKK